MAVDLKIMQAVNEYESDYFLIILNTIFIVKLFAFGLVFISLLERKEIQT
jgi:hypothetical protein